MDDVAQSGNRPIISRRGFLYGTTAAVGAIGVVTATWPVLDHMNPDAGVRRGG